MVEPENLDPHEVLAHLNALGFNDISPQQLKDFLHDLKKLIKYEQRLAYNNKNCECSKSTNESFECICEESAKSCDNFSCTESYASSNISNISSSTTYKNHIYEKYDKVNKSSAGNERVTVHKIPSSFIRPWNLPASKTKKNLDPVKLYHQYKELWNRQKIPGENNHSQLRWIIRNKMLGQEPHPRVVL